MCPLALLSRPLVLGFWVELAMVATADRMSFIRGLRRCLNGWVTSVLLALEFKVFLQVSFPSLMQSQEARIGFPVT